MKIEINGAEAIIDGKKYILQEEKAKQKPTPEERFKELIAGIDINHPVVDFEKYSSSIFWFDGEKVLFEYDFKSNYFWCSYNRIWSFFKSEYSMSYDGIQSFIKTSVEEHFKIKGVTPTTGKESFTWAVEEHFKIKGVTP